MTGIRKGWLALPLVAVIGARFALAAEVSTVDFKLDGGRAVIEITGDAPLEYSQSENAADKQFVIDLKGAKLSTVASRKLDTSSFDSPVRLVSPYAVESDARIVVQLAEMTSPTVTADGNVIRVEFPAGAASTGAASPGAADSPEADPSAAAAMDFPADAEMDAAASSGPENLRDEQNVAKYTTAIENSQFKGKPISINVRNADVRDVLRLIGDASGFNLVVGTDIEGEITLQLEDVPWDQVLSVVLKTMQLGAERNGNVLRVMTLQNMTKEKQGEIAAKMSAQASAPRVTRVFPISYAVPAELLAILTTFSGSNIASDTSVPGATPKLSVDARTSSIVVQALPEEVERMQKLIEILDTETPQVLIEAKIVEATEQFAKGISGNIGAGGQRFGASFNGGDNLTDGLLGSTNLSSSTSDSGGGAFGVSPSISFLPGIQRINAQLNISERESIAKVISSPRLVVLNNEQANIQQAIPILRNVTTVVEGVPIITPEQVDGEISLNVRPQVTNDEKVVMELQINRDTILEGDLIAGRTFNTRVLVDSGSTLVIAGLYTFDRSEDERGIPFLKDIPILGTLFGSSSELTNRTELFVFISPRIMNVSESGLGG